MNKSQPIKPMLAVYRVSVRNSAFAEFGVCSRRFPGKTYKTSYTVTFFKPQNGVIKVTCTCAWARKGPYGRKPCRHVAAVIKQKMPFASVWLDEENAKRQHRRSWPFVFAVDPLIAGPKPNVGGEFFVTERRPGGIDVRGVIR